MGAYFATSRVTKVGCPSAFRPANKLYSAITNAKSPTRLTMNALLPAVVFACTLYQKPISANEHSPTPSQPTNISHILSPNTSTSIAKVNRLSHPKNRQ